MRRTFMIWALSCLTAIAVSARQQAEDTLQTINLGNLMVKGRTVVNKSDRRTVRPTAEQIRTATGGTDLLARLHLPRVTVNKLTGHIALTTGGQVVLCINGVPASETEVASLPVEDIVRVEFIDSPGARYGDAAAVIDCITRHRQSGGNVSADLMNTLGNGHCGINSVAARQNAGRSAWTFDIDHMQVERDKWTRGYDEQRLTDAGAVTRHEEGSAVPIDVRSTHTSLGYTLTDGGNRLLSAKLSWTLDDTPRSEEADRRGTLTTSEGGAPADISEHMEDRASSPALDLYMRQTLGSGRTLTANVVGTYIRSESKRRYSETGAADVQSDVDGRKYSLIAEAAYEHEAGSAHWTAGMRHLQAYTANRYRGSETADVAMRRAETSVYGEYAGHAGRWSWMANATALRLRYSQAAATGICRWAVQPSARLQIEPDGHSYVRYRADLRTVAPQVAEMSSVEQRIDDGQVRRGNPSLKAFSRLSQTLAAGYSCDVAGIDLNVACDHEYRPVMEEVWAEGTTIVRSYANQRSFDRISASATITVRPWKDHITIAITPEINRYISRGNSYLHTHTMPKLGVDVDFSYGPWMLTYSTMRGYANYMYGEMLMEENDMYCLLAGYKRKKWAVQVGALNPFMDEYHMETHGRANVNPTMSRAFTTRPSALMVKLSLNLSHGRQNHDTDGRRMTNTDTDAGIMKGTKK